MRKNIQILSLFAIALLVLCGCSKKSNATASGESESSAEPDTVSVSTHSICDSILIQGMKSTVSISFQSPDNQNSALTDSVELWIAKRLAVMEGIGSTDVEISDGEASGKLSGVTLKEYAGKVLRNSLENDSREMTEMASYMDSTTTYLPEYAREFTISKEYEDSLYVTFTSNLYVYMGGAHGSTLVAGATFSKKDGRRLDWKLISNYSHKEITAIIKKQLMEYFDVHSDKELRDCLLIFNGEEDAKAYDNDFPLPQTAPYLTKNGVNLVYQQYEIAPYAAGLPSVTIKME